MKEQFYIVLPSNSSMDYFGDNTTTHFITQLPEPFRLTRSRNVALVKIPMTFQHVTSEEIEQIVVVENRDTISPPEENEVGKPVTRLELLVPPGICRDIEELISVINNFLCMKGHVKLKREPGGYIVIHRTCSAQCSSIHALSFSWKINKIL